jgi:hypothetical protein
MVCIRRNTALTFNTFNTFASVESAESVKVLDTFSRQVPLSFDTFDNTFDTFASVESAESVKVLDTFSWQSPSLSTLSKGIKGTISLSEVMKGSGSLYKRVFLTCQKSCKSDNIKIKYKPNFTCTVWYLVSCSDIDSSYNSVILKFKIRFFPHLLNSTFLSMIFDSLKGTLP